MLRAGESLNHGVGVFATQSVSAGTLLWREKPLVMLNMKEVAVETERMMAARQKGEDGVATATRVPHQHQLLQITNYLSSSGCPALPSGQQLHGSHQGGETVLPAAEGRV